MNRNLLKALVLQPGNSNSNLNFSFSNDIVEKKKEKVKKEERIIETVKKESIKLSEKDFDDQINLAIALSLSEQMELSNNESKDIVNNNVCDKKFTNDHLTTVNEFDNLIKNTIEKLGGKKVLPNSGGGNCLFHTFSSHLDIDYKQLREDSVNYITMQWDKFKNFALNPETLEPFDSLEDYKNTMLKEGTWGDHLSVMALCELYQVNAIIVVIDNKKILEPIKINVGSSKTVLIKFNSEFHYEAIV